MSILIKDVKMPKKCGECPIVKFDGHGYICRLLGDSHKASVGFPIRMSGCPLAELPEKHGRLIDADALKDTLDYYIREAGWSEEINKALRWVKDEFIDSEQAIIEAEGD